MRHCYIRRSAALFAGVDKEQGWFQNGNYELNKGRNYHVILFIFNVCV